MVQARENSAKLLAHNHMLQLTVSIASIASHFLTAVGRETVEVAHSRHAHNHWNIIENSSGYGHWPPICEGSLVDEGITHAHALLTASRSLISDNTGLLEWIQEDANEYDPDLVHVGTRQQSQYPTFDIYESHYYTCYAIVYDEDGEELGVDAKKTFSYEEEVKSHETWQVMGNTREEINQYLEHHGFKMGDEHDAEHHHANGHVDKVVSEKEKSSLIKSLIRSRKDSDSSDKKQQKTTMRVSSRDTLDFEMDEEIFSKPVESIETEKEKDFELEQLFDESRIDL